MVVQAPEHVTENTKALAKAGDDPKKRRKVVRKKTRAPVVAPVVAPAFDPNVAPRTYSPREPYSPGERINHPTFGTGVVATTPGPGKVEVVFPEGNRTLACAKAESTQHVTPWARTPASRSRARHSRRQCL